MSQLQTLARTAPLWIGGPDESPPPLCGSISPKKDHKVMPGDKVATKSGEDWILAEVISNNGATLLVEDIDAVGIDLISFLRAQWPENFLHFHEGLWFLVTAIHLYGVE